MLLLHIAWTGLRKLDLLARVGKWFPLPDFFLTFVWIYSFTILFNFFQTLFSTHNGSTSNPGCYWIFPPFHVLFSPLPPFSTAGMLFPPGVSCGANNHIPLLELDSRRERRDIPQIWLPVRRLGCVRKCSRQLGWAGRWNWTLTVAEAVSTILFTRLLNKVSFELSKK